MSARFADFDGMIAEFFNDFGFSTTYYSISTGVVDDTTGDITTVVVPITIQAIKMELPRPTNGSTSDANSTIQEGDQVLYVRPTEKVNEFAAALEVNPTSDKVLIQGKQWRVITMKEYNPSASDNILYELYIRK